MDLDGGVLSGAIIRDTLIGVLRPLLKTQKPDKTARPTVCFSFRGKEGLKKAQHVAHSHPPQTRGTISASLEGPSHARWAISASLEGSGSTLEQVTDLRLARG